MKKELTLCVLDGVEIEVIDNKIVLIIDEEKTKRDLWKNQIEFWFGDGNGNLLESGFLRTENNNKLKFTKRKKV